MLWIVLWITIYSHLQELESFWHTKKYWNGSPFCLATFTCCNEQVITSINSVGSFQLFMSINKKGDNKKKATMKSVMTSSQKIHIS